MSRESAEVVVVGAGFAGAATAHHLVRRGVRGVVILEREPVPGSHASGLNAGMARQNSVPEALQPLAIEGVSALAEADAAQEAPLLRRTGSFILADADGAPALQAGLAGMRAAGLRADWLAAAAVAEHVPAVAGGRFEGGVYCADDGVVEIGAALQHHLQRAAEGGARLLTGRTVTRIEVAGGRVRGVETDRESFATPTVVNAAGPWAGPLAAMAGALALPLRPCRRHLVASAALPEVDPDWPFVWDVSHDVYFRPERPGLLFSPCDEDERPPGRVPSDPAALELLARKLEENFPRLASTPVARSWAGLRTLTPDGGFVIGRDPRIDGFVWCAGLGGHGMTVAAAAGRLAAEAALGEPGLPSCDPARFG